MQGVIQYLEGVITRVSNLVNQLHPDSLRYLVNSWVVYLKVDLQLASQCHTTRKNLLSSVSDASLFPDLAPYFTNHPPNTPFFANDEEKIKAKASEPNEVFLIKRVHDALFIVEKTLQAIEQLDIRDERYLTSILVDIVLLAKEANSQLSDISTLTDEGGAELSRLFGQQISDLTRKTAVVYTSLEESIATKSNDIGMELAKQINLIPQESHQAQESTAVISGILSGLPGGLESIHHFLQGMDSQNTNLNKDAIEANSKILQERLLNLANANPITALKKVPDLAKSLLKLSSELINTSHDSVIAAHNKGIQELNQFRHQDLPALINELEILEEKLCLQPGTISGQIIPHLAYYYHKAAKAVNSLAMASQQIHKTGAFFETTTGKKLQEESGVKTAIKSLNTLPVNVTLGILFDGECLLRIEAYRYSREVAALEKQNKKADLSAAERFFELIELYKLEEIERLPRDVKLALHSTYCLIKSQIKLIDTDLDRELEKALLSNPEPITESITTKDSSTSTSFTNQLMGVATTQSNNLIVYLGSFLFYSKEQEGLEEGNLCARVLEAKESIMQCVRADNQTKIQGEFDAKKIVRAAEYSKAKLQTPAKAFYDENVTLDTLKQNKRIALKIPSSGDDLHDSIAANQNLLLIQWAEEGLDEFDAILKNQSGVTINAIGQEDKAKLIKAYAKFQRLLLKNENNSLMLALSNELIPLGKPYAIITFYSLQTKYKQYLNKKKDELTSIKKRGIPALAAAQSLPQEPNSIVPEGDKKPVPLSEQLSNQIINPLVTYLKTQLTKSNREALFGINPSLGLKDMDFSKTYLDSDEVALYKNLLRILMSLQQSLEVIEKINNKPSILDLLTINKINNNRVELYNAYFLLRGNPCLQALREESQNIINQIYASPIGPFLPENNNVLAMRRNEPVNIVAEWRKQKNLYLSAVNDPGFKLVTAPQEESLPLDNAEEEVIKAGIRITNLIEDYNTEHLIGDIGIAHSSIDRIADYLYNIQPNTLENKAKSPEQIKSELLKKKSDLLGKINKFIQRVSSISVLNMQTYIDVTNLLITIEQEVSSALKHGRKLSLHNLKRLYSEGLKIIYLLDDIEFKAGLKAGALSDPVIQYFNEFYQSLVLNLSFDDDKDALLLLLGTNITNDRYQNECERLRTLGQQPQINTEILEALDKLEAFGANNPDFADLDTQVLFVSLYGVLQPHLYKIDIQFNGKFFLRSLTNKAGFEKAYQKIRDLQDALVDYANKDNKILQLQKAAAAERIADLKVRVQNEALSPNNLERQFARNRLRQLLQEKIIKSLSSTKKPLDRNLATHVATSILEAFDSAKPPFEEGSYLATLDELCKQFGPGMDIKTRLEEKLGTIITDIRVKHKDLLHKYDLLNNYIEQLTKLIDTEKAKQAREDEKANPGREEKIIVLNRYIIQLQHIELPTDNTATEVLQKACETIFGRHGLNISLTAYDHLIGLHDQLNTMQKSLTELPIDDEKHALINELRSILHSNTNKSLSKRIEEAQELATSKKSEEVMRDGSHVIQVYWRQFVRSILKFFGATEQITDQKQHEQVKKQLIDLKKHIDETLPPQSGP